VGLVPPPDHCMLQPAIAREGASWACMWTSVEGLSGGNWMIVGPPRYAGTSLRLGVTYVPSMCNTPPLRGSRLLGPLAARWVGPPGALPCCYLVDSASSHMLVSKIKPCMSKYKQLVL
jgi:hypothetical protein